VTTPVVFSGRYRAFRRALSLVVGLYSAAGIDPEVSQVVASCLLTAEHDLAIAGFIFTTMIYQVEEADFFRPTGM